MDRQAGGEVVYRQWGVSGPRAVLLLVHGLGAHTGRWEAMADFFVRKGIASYAIELRPQGGAGGPAEAKPGPGYFRRYRENILRLADIAFKDHPAKKVFLVGESMGGLLAFTIAAADPGLFAGLVCMSPAFASKLALSPSGYLRMFAPIFYNPSKEVDVPFDSSMCTRDIEYRAMMESDSREHRKAPSGLLAGILIAQAKAAAAAKRLTTPALFLVAGEDSIVDPRATARIFGKLAVRDKELIEYPEMYHALSVDLGKEKVFGDIMKWVEGRL